MMSEKIPLHSCRKASELISESFEHKLSLKKQITLTAHLTVCKTCVFCFNQIKTLRMVWANYSQAVMSLPTSDKCCLSEEAKEKIKSTLRKANS